MRLKPPIGSTVKHGSQDWQVVGVVKDFIFTSPYEPVPPVIVIGSAYVSDWSWVSARLNLNNITGTNMEIAQRIVKKYTPEYPFEYIFAEDAYTSKFDEEKRTGKLAGISTGLAVLISCLGLFSLAAFAAEQRTKEIGIRKVLGASVSKVMGLLSSDFVKLVLIAVIIASPIAWWAMSHWLQGFAYSIDLQW
jgi:putative ABC transport system permease protein